MNQCRRRMSGSSLKCVTVLTRFVVTMTDIWLPSEEFLASLNIFFYRYNRLNYRLLGEINRCGIDLLKVPHLTLYEKSPSGQPCRRCVLD